MGFVAPRELARTTYYLPSPTRRPYLPHHLSHLTPHASYLTPHASHLIPHTSHLTLHTSRLRRSARGARREVALALRRRVRQARPARPHTCRGADPRSATLRQPRSGGAPDQAAIALGATSGARLGHGRAHSRRRWWQRRQRQWRWRQWRRRRRRRRRWEWRRWRGPCRRQWRWPWAARRWRRPRRRLGRRLGWFRSVRSGCQPVPRGLPQRPGRPGAAQHPCARGEHLRGPRTRRGTPRCEPPRAQPQHGALYARPHITSHSLQHTPHTSHLTSDI